MPKDVQVESYVVVGGKKTLNNLNLIRRSTIIPTGCIGRDTQARRDPDLHSHYLTSAQHDEPEIFA